MTRYQLEEFANFSENTPLWYFDEGDKILDDFQENPEKFIKNNLVIDEHLTRKHLYLSKEDLLDRLVEENLTIRNSTGYASNQHFSDVLSSMLLENATAIAIWRDASEKGDTLEIPFVLSDIQDDLKGYGFKRNKNKEIQCIETCITDFAEV